jgi:hypothetical protein
MLSKLVLCYILYLKDVVLRISSAHNKGGPADIQQNIAQILQLSNFFELKRLLYIHLPA